MDQEIGQPRAPAARRSLCVCALGMRAKPMLRARLLSVALLASAATPGSARKPHKNCTHADVWTNETLSYDLSKCISLNATGVLVDAPALALALPVTGSDMSSLMLVMNGLNADGIEAIAQSISDHQSLGRWYIDQNNVSGTGAESIARALEANTVLTELTLSRTNLRNEGAVAISELLRKNAVLAKLGLEMNDISTPGVAALSGALQENSALRQLNLGVNPIFPTGAAQIGNMLKKNTGLLSLNLRYAGLQDGGVVALATALQENTALRDLDVWFNMVTDVGAQALGHMLGKNHVLARLNLWDNNISDTGGAALADGVQNNKGLDSLHLGRNERLTDGAAVDFQRAMYVNEALTFLDFGVGNTGIGSHFEQPLAKACGCNRELRKELHSANYDEEEAKVRETAAKCRSGALSKVPLRVSIKEMMRAQGIDPEKRRKEAIEAAKGLEKLQEEMAKMTPEEQKEVKRLMKLYRESVVNKTKGEGAGGEPEKQEAKIRVNSPHQQHLENIKREKGAKEGKPAEVPMAAEAEPKKKKNRATREQQEKNKKKREAGKQQGKDGKEEL